MFHKSTKLLAKQLDPDGSFVPVRCPVDEKHFRPLCLVQRKRKNPWWQSNPYHKTEYRLHDILLSGDCAAKLEVQDSGQVAIVDKVDGKMQGNFSGPVDLGTITLMGLTSMTHTTSVKVKKIHISSSVLHSITENGKVNMCHGFVKQSKEFKRDLYVITEAIETVEETQFEETSKTEGSIFSEVYIKVKLNGARDSKKTVIIPKACALAFRAKQLQIKEGSLEISDYQSNKTQTFVLQPNPIQDWTAIRSALQQPKARPWSQKGRKKHLMCPFDIHFVRAAAKGSSPPAPPPPIPTVPARAAKSAIQMDDAELMVSKDKMKNLQMEVKEECMDLSSLSADLRGKFLTGFVAIMQKNNLLHELESQLEQALDSQSKLKVDSPELQGLVENLQDSNGALTTHLAESVLYFLEALNELTEFHLLLLAESVEKKIVSKQLALVESILNNGSSKKEWKFAMDAQKISEEDLNITGALIELSGATVQKRGTCLAGTGNSAAFSALSALYVALYVLNLLLASQDGSKAYVEYNCGNVQMK